AALGNRHRGRSRGFARRSGAGARRDACRFTSVRSAGHQGQPQPAGAARDRRRGPAAGAAHANRGSGQPGAARSRDKAKAIHVAPRPTRQEMTQFDVSVGISPRQSFESWAGFMAALEAEGVGRVWVIDSQLAMKDVYAGLVVAALNTKWLDLGTGVTNAVTR